MMNEANQPQIINLAIKDKQALYAAYMPFLRHGGLFVPTTQEYGLGDEVFMVIDLMEGKEQLAVAGNVVWMTPRGASNKRAAGIGVQFSDQDQGNAQKKIETYLAGALQSDRRTHTL